MKKLLRRYRALPSERRAAAIRAGWLIAAVRVGLTVLPFRVLLRLVHWVADAGGDRRAARDARFDKDSAVWAVETAARRILRRNPCLPKALAVLILFRRAGVPAEFHIGVAREAPGHLTAHAWVESRGDVVVGGDVPISGYTRLSNLDARQP